MIEARILVLLAAKSSYAHPAVASANIFMNSRMKRGVQQLGCRSADRIQFLVMYKILLSALVAIRVLVAHVTYVFDNGASTLTRNVNGVATVIATDVKDFCVTISDLDETATTQITFQPRFRTVASASAIAATTYFQTTLTRNTR